MPSDFDADGVDVGSSDTRNSSDRDGEAVAPVGVSVGSFERLSVKPVTEGSTLCDFVGRGSEAVLDGV